MAHIIVQSWIILSDIITAFAPSPVKYTKTTSPVIGFSPMSLTADGTMVIRSFVKSLLEHHTLTPAERLLKSPSGKRRSGPPPIEQLLPMCEQKPILTRAEK